MAPKRHLVDALFNGHFAIEVPGLPLDIRH